MYIIYINKTLLTFHTPAISLSRLSRLSRFYRRGCEISLQQTISNISDMPPPLEEKFVPCLGKICALPREIFFLLILAKMSPPQPAQRPQNYFTHNIAITPAIRIKGNDRLPLRNLPFLIFISEFV